MENQHFVRGKRITADHVFDVINTLLMIVLCVLVVYPLYYVLVASFTEPSVVSSGRMLFYP